MKQVLNEDNAKLVLEERFTLLEAGEIFAEKDAAIKKLATYNDDLKAAIIEKITGKNGSVEEFFDSQEIESLKDKETKARDALKGEEFNNISGHITAYTRAVKELTGKVKENGNGNPLNGAPALKEKLDQVDELARTLQTEKDNAKKTEIYTNLKAAFEELTAAINETIGKQAEAKKETDESNPDAEKVKTVWNIVANTLKLVNTIDEDPKDKVRLQELANGVQEIDINADIKAIMASIDKTREACAKFLQDQEARNFEKKAIASEAQRGKKDWAKLFTDAGDDTEAIDAIWDDYYETEWGSDADKVKDLGIAFVKELSSLGYTESSNPFIAFIKYAFKHDYNLTSRTYPAVHNAYLKGYINNQDLRKQSASTKGSENILYCKDLYNDAPTEIYELFGLQFQTVKAFPNRINVLKQKYPDEEDIFRLVIAIFSNQIPIKDLAEAEPPRGNFEGATLRSLTDVKAAFSLCFGQDAEDEETEKDAGGDVENIANKLKQNGLEKKAPSYIAIKYDKGNGRLTKLAAQSNDNKIATLSENDVRVLAGLLQGYTFNENSLTALIKALKGNEK